jgi:hypothetical protein
MVPVQTEAFRVASSVETENLRKEGIVLWFGFCRITLRVLVFPAEWIIQSVGRSGVSHDLPDLTGFSARCFGTQKGCKSFHGNNFSRRSEEAP